MTLSWSRIKCCQRKSIGGKCGNGDKPQMLFVLCAQREPSDFPFARCGGARGTLRKWCEVEEVMHYFRPREPSVFAPRPRRKPEPPPACTSESPSALSGPSPKTGCSHSLQPASGATRGVCGFPTLPALQVWVFLWPSSVLGLSEVARGH